VADAPRRRALGRAALTGVAVIAADQLTKHTIGTAIKPGQVRHILPGLSFVHERNTGVAFSFLAGTGALVYVVTITALVGLTGFLLKRPARRLLWLPTGLLVGGALSNLIDRVLLGSVIDFIKLPDWPAFNVADSCITVGVVILVLVIERGGDG
jgi:signal peptidase II